MVTTTILVQTALVLMVICLCPFTESSESLLNRSKRGFRLNSASRVAHGYGKRGYGSPTGDDSYQQMARDALDNLVSEEDDKASEWSIMSVEEMTSLLQSHPSLARALVKKFIDIDGDGLITAEELFRSPLRK